MRRSTRTMLILASVMIAGLATVLTALGLLVKYQRGLSARSGRHEGNELMLERLTAVAGERAEKCGFVSLVSGGGGNLAATNACVKRASLDGRAFWAYYQLQGIDSEVITGIARDSAGTLHGYMFDSFGMIPVKVGPDSFRSDWIRESPCATPPKLEEEEDGHISCASPNGSG